MAGHAAQLEQTLDRLDTIEQELSALQEVVRHTDALATVGGLAAGLAHELNNLLTPALTYAQLAERSPQNQELVSKALRRTIESIQTVTRLLDATLDLAAPTKAPAANSCTTEEALEAALACLSRDPGRDGITIECDIEPGLQIRITKQELQQVLVNLLTNATRVLRRKGGGTIWISARRLESDAHIELTDSGPGIPDKLRTSIFKPFITSESPTSGEPQQGGRGLGLAICHRTIASRRGRITADSGPGGGARFTIELPRAEQQRPDSRAAA